MKRQAEDLYYWVALSTAPNVGNKRMAALVMHFGTPRQAMDASLKELQRVEDVGEITAASIKSQVDWKEAEKQVEEFEKSGCGWICITDSDYPPRLKQIPDPPCFLFAKGDFSEADELAVAIVGSRNSTDYGKSITQRIAGDLVANGITIISGLASGIDTFAHQSALASGGRTIAVLGSGLDIIYPSENKKMAQEIGEKGALISEFLFGTTPLAENFPKRNRIISGLSLGVVVVEAPSKSGALLTAECALDQNREVFAVPGNLGKKTSEGTNNLIRQGAKLVTNAKDILEELNLAGHKKLKESWQTLPQLPEEEKIIYQRLTEEPIHIDKLAAVSNLSVPKVLTGLLNLELKGLARQLSGKNFVRA